MRALSSTLGGLLLLLSACQEVVYDGPTLKRDCKEGPCGIPPDGRGGYQDGRDDALAAVRVAAEAACDRLWGDCASLCDSDWVYCGGSREQCVEDYARSAVEDLAYPVYSEELANACAEQLAIRSCIDLDPNSPECNSAVLEGCPNDEDGYGRPYSWLAAYDIPELPTTISPHLCEAAEEWFAVHLEAGEALAVTLAGGHGSAWLGLYAPVGAVGGAQDVENMGHSVHVDTDDTRQEIELFEAAPVAGTYYLQIDLNRVTQGDLEIAIGTDRRLPPGPEEFAVEALGQVYDALCSRLHSDCGSLCGEVDFYCGGSQAECAAAYTRSAVEVLFDRGAHTLDDAAVAACAADLSSRTCGDLGNAACEGLLTPQCAADPMAFGRPYAGRMAAPVTLPASLDLALCEDVRQFFRVDLAEGDQLVMRTAQEPIGSLRAKLYPPGVTDEDLLEEDNYFDSDYVDATVERSNPVPTTGTYWLSVEYNSSGSLTLMLER